MQALIKTQFERCPESVRQHCLRTGGWMKKILKELGREELLSIWQLEEMSPVDYHDIGKADTEDTFGHCTMGAQFFKNLYATKAACFTEQIFCSIATDLCRFHHFRYDGKDNPKEMSGQDIPVIARVCAVANAFDHLLKSGRQPDEACAEIESGSGTLYDPLVVQALCMITIRK
ncbi:HD domain-containing phosphohydrolase [Eubacterium sp. 1001713B170207_170306_E7]|uniref:HD-GYP domain-containing protein n=1 Tax=Eubacterium sp. 1001713B170207_170306_E7 TaxID=2787097 RepID=UPI00189958F6|nr:HD domain-containing phosphohydrolase [Eubacterium sp. 1001713B170207_170306_E7]